MSLSDENKVAIAQKYFRLADAGDRKLVDLFHEDATFYFPKFGVGRGRTSIFEMVIGFEGSSMVKGGPFDAANQGLIEPSAVADAFWKLYTERTTLVTKVG